MEGELLMFLVAQDWSWFSWQGYKVLALTFGLLWTGYWLWSIYQDSKNKRKGK